MKHRAVSLRLLELLVLVLHWNLDTVHLIIPIRPIQHWNKKLIRRTLRGYSNYRLNHAMLTFKVRSIFTPQYLSVVRLKHSQTKTAISHNSLDIYYTVLFVPRRVK